MLSMYLQSTGQLPPGQQLPSPRLGEASPRQTGYLQGQPPLQGSSPGQPGGLSAGVPIASQRSLGQQQGLSGPGAGLQAGR